MSYIVAYVHKKTGKGRKATTTAVKYQQLILKVKIFKSNFHFILF